MSDLPDISGLLEAERKRLTRKPKTKERRDRERRARRWSTNLLSVWALAHLLTDDELQWLAQVTDATRDKQARIVRNGWTGRHKTVWQPTSVDDALRLQGLERSLSDRQWEEARHLRRQRRQQLAERLTRLGVQADRYTDFDTYAAIDRCWADLTAHGRAA